MVTKLAKSIIDNKETVSHYEKIVKVALILAFLTYMAISNGALEDEKSKLLPSMELVAAFTNYDVWKDFFSREGSIMVIFVALFISARYYNNYLDNQEREFIKEARKEKKRAKMMGAVDGEEDDSSSEEESEKEEEPEEKVKCKKPLFYPLNPKE